MGQAHAASIEVRTHRGVNSKSRPTPLSSASLYLGTIASSAVLNITVDGSVRFGLFSLASPMVIRYKVRGATRDLSHADRFHTCTVSLAHLQLHNDVESLKDTPTGITRIEQ